jgi:mRNA interferase YafQ
MRTIEWTGQFKRDYRREAKGRHRDTLDAHLFSVVDSLANDMPLEPRRRDHPLTGTWKDFRDRHTRPDLVPICEKPNPSTLRLVRLRSHSELGV